jgi:hypothetical protein
MDFCADDGRTVDSSRAQIAVLMGSNVRSLRNQYQLTLTGTKNPGLLVEYKGDLMPMSSSMTTGPNDGLQMGVRLAQISKVTSVPLP